eukprot:GHUV01031829.1.p2 GENE.GHUV01031829.1~~GHUV01031829.1.p2  ORF type:complete len:135 (+),score=23.54 GHUV01031829.1:875-1279(+)
MHADMPYKCSNGQAMQYCRDSSPCRSKVCRPGYYCVESYCGSCSATCIRSRSKASCGKSGRFSLVCGRDGKTYASLCHSKRAGVKVVSKGACKAADSSKLEVLDNHQNSICCVSPYCCQPFLYEGSQESGTATL